MPVTFDPERYRRRFLRNRQAIHRFAQVRREWLRALIAGLEAGKESLREPHRRTAKLVSFAFRRIGFFHRFPVDRRTHDIDANALHSRNGPFSARLKDRRFAFLLQEFQRSCRSTTVLFLRIGVAGGSRSEESEKLAEAFSAALCTGCFRLGQSFPGFFRGLLLKLALLAQAIGRRVPLFLRPREPKRVDMHVLKN